MPREVEGLNLEKVKKTIAWQGKVRLHQLGEDDDCLLGIAEWPKRSGKTYLCCATSGLLFEQQSGRCLQSAAVQLRLETLTPAVPKNLRAYLAARKERGYGHTSRHLLTEG